MAEPNNNQMAFWEAMKEKYERRNESLKQQEVCLKKRLEQLQEIMEKQKAGDDYDCVPEKLEKPSLVQCWVEKGKNLILGSCKCGDPKVGEDLLCACHITDPKAPLNVDSNQCPLQVPEASDGCSNPSCDFYVNNQGKIDENPSTFSLKTTDIYYMDKLADLVKAEKNMQQKIEDLEKREHSYLNAIHDLREAMKKQKKPDPMNEEFKRLTEGLEEENKKLRNELEDLRLELKHCFERVEGPLRRSLEDQRDKCAKLESDIKDLQVKSKMKEDFYLKQINEVKAKLCQACCTMVDLNSVNSKLKNDLCCLTNKCTSLEDDLLKQQMKEAENILKFKSALAKRKAKSKVQAKGDESEDLGHIAKKLGDTLKEVCPCVSDVPSGLTETAENIRQLTEFVAEKGAQQRKKRKGKIHQVSTTSCSCGSDLKVSNTQSKVEEVVSCVCSNSSLRIRPRINQKDFEGEEVTCGCSPSESLASVPMMNIKATKQTSTAPMRKTASKGCTCCPAQNECDHPLQKASIDTVCCCSDMDTKRTGPSEEVIAVKNLGTLSIPPGQFSVGAGTSKAHDQTLNKSMKDKLTVDTTCDVLDKPPKDIHVVTTIAKTGSLEITTEGPPGVIETKVNYLADGKVEIVTKLVDRHKMDDYLDGTLLQLPEGPPDCTETTCEGQCEDKATSADGCPEVDCNKSKTCGGLCDDEEKPTGENQENLVDKAAIDQKNSADMGKVEAEVDQNKVVDKDEVKTEKDANNTTPYGKVVVNNNFILIGAGETHPFMTGEWKNVKFLEDPKEEALLQDLILTAKPMRRKVNVHEDITSEPESFRLSSRQSLTDVETYSKEADQMKSSCSLLYPDVLETISEGDEDQTDSTRTDNDVSAEEEDTERSTLTEDSSERMDEESNVDKPGQFSTAEILVREGILRAPPVEISEEFTPSETEIQLGSRLPLDDLDQQRASSAPQEIHRTSHESLKNTRSSTSCLQVPKEGQITEFYEMSQNINLLSGKIVLRQSKSMYEKRGSTSEYLRICKSATLSLGGLKIDLERLKLSSKDPNVGDFGIARLEDRGRVVAEDVQPTTQAVVDVKAELCREMDEKIVSELMTEGCTPFDTYQTIPDQMYQCYVCSCSNQKDKDDQEKKNQPRNNQDLEQRIDRLLEIDPLADKARSPAMEQCNCARKKQEAPPEKKCKCGADKEKAIPKHQGDNVQHGEDCTCVDCICNPCNFKKATAPCDCDKCDCGFCYSKNLTSTAIFELSKPPEITVMNVSLPCDCGGACACNPCMDESKRPKPPSRGPSKTQQKDTACKRCAQMASKKTDIAVGSSKINVNASKTEVSGTRLPDTWKSVVNCACLPPDEDKKAVCDCKTCECKPCGYPEKARAPCDCKPAKKEKKGPSGNCDCALCECQVCGDMAGIGDFVNRPPPATYPFSAMNCDCKLCECLFCSDPKTRDKEAPHGACACLPKCLCEHCPVNAAAGEVGRKPGGKEECACLPKCLCDHCPVKGAQSPIGKELGVAPKTALKEECACLPKCLCEHCPVKEGPKGPLHGVGEKPAEKEKCACLPKCLCDHCPVNEGPLHGVGEKPTEKEKCACLPKCLCDHCPVNEGSAPRPAKDKECVCLPKCLCKPCPVNEEQIGDATELTCDCQKCECDPCSDKKPLAIKNLKSTLRKIEHDEKMKNVAYDKKVPCDCATCECPTCTGKFQDNEKSKGDHPEGPCPCLPTDRQTNEPIGECKNCDICCSDQEVEVAVTEPSRKLIPCDCKTPCRCKPCPDPNIGGGEECQLIGDADRVKDELRGVLNKIGCTCDQAEADLKPLVKQASVFETTVSKMKMKLNNLQEKCKDKDRIIDAMTDELKLRSQSGVFADLLHDLAHPKERFTPDFTRTYVCDFLPRPKHAVGSKLQSKRSSACRFDNKLEPILELDRYLPGAKEDAHTCPKHQDVSGMEILDIRRVTIDSILIKWRGPSNLNGVTGYQIFVNDELKYRVLSPNRTNAVIDSLDLSSSLEIMLFAMCYAGRCEPPALATYKI
ncbi:uncharacterized protein LOC123672202 [Harmonia axyridis]|uniref:uncharacterized protein LOC123672202 n=1 Tax=Harmonia axyridis TaxID=115357 RepID=UPI001E2761C9|nr:uncharacterized protein LOC123672202 [Harmonia axyridis]